MYNTVSFVYEPQMWPWPWRQQQQQNALHFISSWCNTILGLVTKGWAVQNTSFRQSVCLLLKKGGYPENLHILGVGVESYCLHNVSTLTDIFVQIYVSFHYTFFFHQELWSWKALTLLCCCLLGFWVVSLFLNFGSLRLGSPFLVCVWEYINSTVQTGETVHK